MIPQPGIAIPCISYEECRHEGYFYGFSRRFLPCRYVRVFYLLDQRYVLPIFTAQPALRARTIIKNTRTKETKTLCVHIVS